MSASASVHTLTMAEAAQQIGVSKTTLWRMVNGKVENCPTLPCLRIGKVVLIRRESLERYIEALEGVQSPA